MNHLICARWGLESLRKSLVDSGKSQHLLTQIENGVSSIHKLSNESQLPFEKKELTLLQQKSVKISFSYIYFPVVRSTNQ